MQISSVKGHGGDIYRNQITLDFSVNVNPLGIPLEVKQALHEAVDRCSEYPDWQAQKLTEKTAAALSVKPEYLLFGNGASELLMAVMHAVRPTKTVIPVPSFYGYEYVAKTQQEVCFYDMQQEDYTLTERFFEVLTKDVSMLILANPNNPTGKLLEPSFLRALLRHCMQNEIIVVLDECFIAFCREDASMLSEIEQYPNLLLLRAFTKLYAIPGVRLGVFISSNEALLQRIRRELPEWNLSTFAEAAGCACVSQNQWIERTQDYVEQERSFLVAELEKLGIRVWQSSTNFLLLFSERPLYELLLAKGILIRDCENFRGLGKGFYRIAVKRHEENELLIEKMRELCAAGIAQLLPQDIEKKSFAIISQELETRGIILPKEQEMVMKRVIHTSADFEYVKTLAFSSEAVAIAKELIKQGADIVTDTNMALSGINKKVLASFGGEAHCFMADEEVARLAKERGTTRAAISMEKAAKIAKPVIFAVGNAPTALIQLYDMMQTSTWRPAFIIGVPVGFVNVEAAKELILSTEVPYIINIGRKGGSNVAAAICNAILYQIEV